MVKLVKYLILLICVNAFAQKTYEFDYYTLYDTENSENTQYIIGNSKDSSYFVYVFLIDGVISSMNLYDTKSDSQYEFDIQKRSFDSVKSFSDFVNSYTIYKYIFSERKKFLKDIFEIEYDPINDEETVIVIKTFKNKRKKKLLFTNVYRVKNYPFVKNQFYIANIVFAFAFDLNKIKTNGVVIEQNVIFAKTPEKNFSKNLIDIGQLDFSIELQTEPVITRGQTIIQIR